MAEERHFETPNGDSHLNEWETGFAEEVAGELEDELRRVTAAYSDQGPVPEWESFTVSPAVSMEMTRIPLPIRREEQIPKVRRVIAHCRQIAIPAALAVLKDADREIPVFSPKESVRNLLAEFEEMMRLAESEVAALENSLLGEDEFNAELAASESAQELALTEVLAAEAVHSELESEAQSLLAAALPVNLSLLGAGAGFKNILPALTQANARLAGALFKTGPLSRQAMGLLPSIQRRVISGLNAAKSSSIRLTPNLANRMFAAQSAKVLAMPAIIGKALVRNQAVRNGTMPECPRRRQHSKNLW